MDDEPHALFVLVRGIDRASIKRLRRRARRAARRHHHRRDPHPRPAGAVTTGNLSSPDWLMACDRRVEWACGCVTWHELLPGGSWITRRWPCSRHDHG